MNFEICTIKISIKRDASFLNPISSPMYGSGLFE